MADAPLHRTFLQKSFPAVLPWQKNAMIFDIPGPRNQNEGTFAKTALYNTTLKGLWFFSNLRTRSFGSDLGIEACGPSCTCHTNSGETTINVQTAEWLGVKFVYVFPFIFRRKQGKHINTFDLGNLRKMPGQSLDNLSIIPEQSREQIVYAFKHRNGSGSNMFMCFPFSETHKQIRPRKCQENAGTVPGQSQYNPGTIP